MTDPSDYTAKIRAKGLDATGITEQLAGDMYRNKGRHYIAIVELRVDETHEKADGTRKVDLVLTQVEPALSTDLEEHLRELTRVGYLNRQQSDGQLAIDQSLGHERTVADVVASGKSLRPHPFLPDDVAKDTPICDVCGGIEASAVHSTQEILDDPGTEEEEPTVEEQADPYAFVHAKDEDNQVGVAHCGLAATFSKSIRLDADLDNVTCPKCLQFQQGDGLDVDGEPVTDPEAWEYEAPEPTTKPLSVVPDPFTA